MVYCVAYRCHNRSKRGSGISFFNFPSDPVRRKIWTQNINRANFTPTKYSRLCSDHFERDCYEKHVDDMARIGYQGGYNKLKPDAIPTIFYSRDVSKYKFKRADGDNTKVSVRSTMRFRRQSNRPRRAYGKRQHNYGDIEKISAQEDGRLFDKHLQLKSSSESREQVDQEDIVRDYVSDRSKKTDRLNTFEENLVKEANGRDMKVPKTNGIDNKSSASNVTVKHENILTKSMLEQLVSEKILECLSEGSKNEIASLKQKCLILEKSVERWKKKAHELQKHIAMVLSGKRNCAGCWKGKVATRSVGLYVRMPSGGIASPLNQIRQSGIAHTSGKQVFMPPSKMSTSFVKDVGTRSSSIPPIPVHLIANAATSQAVTVGAHRPIETTSSHSIIKVIDLTREKKENSKLGSLVTSIPEVSTSASNTVVKLSPRGSSLLSNVQTGPSGGVISIPTVYSSVPSVVHVIPSGAQISSSFLSSTGTTLRLAKSSSSVLSQGIPQGAKVTYLVPASSTALLGKNGESSPVFTSAVTLSSSSRITNSARQPIQTFLVRMASQQSGSYYRLLQTVNSSTVNLQTPVLNSAGSVLTTASSNTTTTQKSTSDTVVTPGSMQNTINLTCTSGTVMISCVSQHPAPLPEATLPSDVKDLPPKPALKASRVVNGIVLSWNMMLNGSYPTVVTYQLYGYQESARPPSTSMWKKVGDIKALPLPMACTLTQFVEGHKYHFAVRAVDVQKRIGAFSNPAFIFLSKQASSTS
ncbi:uncharacterized protein LOC143254425 isoform X6 [Tachypleus tridentatus]|uniref:uncharacterized protein LOC143254425 isoform X6 n=1 Tax=Tachypleus tridentatus TaxID=6853 RepID=UPI003FD5D990